MTARLPERPGSLAPPHGVRWLLPRLGIALFLLALGGLLWVLQRQETEERRSAVIRDALWLEQNARLSFERDAEQLAQIDPEPWRLSQADLGVRAELLLHNSPGLIRVLVLDATGGVLSAAPPGLDPGKERLEPGARAALGLALATGNAAYSPARETARGPVFQVFVPFYRAGKPAGAVGGTYGLRPLLATLVPWWLAERHLVTLRDAEGAVLAAKSNVEAVEPEATHQILLDPPGHGLVLRLDSYGAEGRLLRNVLATAILLLALAVLWNLWALRRHVQRRLATEEALRREHAFRKAMEDSLHTGMRAVDLEGRVVYANPAFCAMVGYGEEEIIGRAPPQPYWPREEVESIEAVLRAARSPGGRGAGFELKLVRRGGEPFDALLYEAPLIDAEGRQTGWMGSVLDITERKRARELARQQDEKLAATARLVTVGEMASTIAHELNQPLSAIASYATGSVNLLERGAARPDELGEALRKISEQAQRAGRIIRRVHDFVRKSAPARSVVRVNAVVEEALGFAEAEARKRRIRIRARRAGGDPEVQADPVLLQQVVLNLVRNAMDAMAGVPPERREIEVTTEAADGAITVSISDRGTGIPAEVEPRLFEPFFTTKPEGMGMGLNICRSILEAHRGRLWAEPNPGGGATFLFSLPREDR